MRSRCMSLAATALAVLLAGCAQLGGQPDPATSTGAADVPVFSPEAAATPMACPADVLQQAPGTRCLSGRDSAGAFYLIALPAGWQPGQGDLVLHAHGGPSLGAPTLARTVEDLQRWAIMPRAGYAWAGSSFRQGGVAVRAAAEDTERLRQLFVQQVGAPRRTLLHGQSWGASVAAKAAETYTRDATGRRPYDAVLLTSGVLAGGSQAYQFRLDLRVVYQALCGNHPRPGEAAYQLWQGLPAGARMTQAELRSRVNDCLGLDQPAAQRTVEQRRKLDTLTQVIRIPASSVFSHLSWATWHFQDIAEHRSGGGSVFSNEGVRYTGSADDEALNAAVARYRADPAAVARFAADTDLTGRIPVPVLTVHGIDDPTAFVEMDDSFRRTMAAAGTAGHLVQTFTAHDTHSYLADPVYPALLDALQAWLSTSQAPTPQAVADRCEALAPRFGPGCRFQPGYRPPALATRVPERSVGPK